jgi:hypothetical protein
MAGTALEVLEERLARGEISTEEFESLRARLQPPPPTRKLSKGHPVIGLYLVLAILAVSSWSCQSAGASAALAGLEGSDPAWVEAMGELREAFPPYRPKLFPVLALFLLVVTYLRERRHRWFPRLVIAAIVLTPVVAILEVANMAQYLAAQFGVPDTGMKFSAVSYSFTEMPLVFHLMLLLPMGLIPSLVRLDREP